MKVVLFNGPRTAGKDTLASALASRLSSRHPVSILPMTKPMKMGAIRTVRYPNFTEQFDGNIEEAYEYFEANKDVALACLGGKTPRELYIEYGNKLRAEHGPDVLGDAWLNQAAQIVNHERGWLLVPDVRFQPEVNAAIRLAGKNNVMLVYVVRTGTSWERDIGRFCEHDWSCTCINNGSLDDLGGRVERLLERAWQ